MPSQASGEALCACLHEVLALLEQGDGVAAAERVPAMNALIAALPPALPEPEAEEAKRLLDRCWELERGLQAGILEGMRRLGAARKSAAYRRLPVRP